MEEVTSPTYKVKAGGFEGPLELLLSLIEQRKLFVSEVSLAEVTNDYISHIKSLKELKGENKIADISYFVLIAATLILIKSKSLLPNIELTEEETEKISDLEKRLELYQIIKNASLFVKNDFGTKIIFWPVDRTWEDPIFIPDQSMTIDNLSQSILEVISKLPEPKEKKPELEVKKIINIDEVIDSLTERVKTALSLSFKEFASNHNAKNKEEAKVHVIVSFLAMLELVREGIIDVIQDNSFEDIKMSKQALIENY